MSTEVSFSAFPLPRIGTSEAGRVETQWKTRGHAAGYAAGLRTAETVLAERLVAMERELSQAKEAAHAELERAVTVLAAAIRAAEARTLPVVQDSQDALATAAIDLAEAIIGQELSDGPRSARAALTRALGTVPPAELTGIRLHPDDRALLDEDLPEGVRLIADPTLARGDAIAELPDGYLDARISTALNRAKAAILGEDS